MRKTHPSITRRFAPPSLVLAMVLMGMPTGCGGEASDQNGAAQGPPPADVSVAPVVRRAVKDWDQFNGRIEAVHLVDIRPRVAGYLNTVHFQEGALVEKGDPLFTIDTREYQAVVNRVRASLASAETRLTLARQEAQRAQNLIDVQAISAEEFDQRQSDVAQAKTQIAAVKAELEQAELNLEFALITAPIAGRIGEAHVKTGNLVQPGEQLATLVSVDPVYVVFEGDENIYLKYQEQARRGDRPSSREFRNPVRVGLVNEEGYPHHGEMDFVDNVLDPSTGTIRGRAVLPNPNGKFTPGLFARVRLLGSSEYEALLITDLAVLTDQDRKYVYVLSQTNTAERRDIVLGREVDGLRVVLSGLSENDQVVVNGVRKIFFPGAPLAPTTVTMDDPLASGAMSRPSETTER
ncbi:MAG: efflux RND transporter periplasmic adaptor subunit [Pseudomonadota bacterium]